MCGFCSGIMSELLWSDPQPSEKRGKTRTLRCLCYSGDCMYAFMCVCVFVYLCIRVCLCSGIMSELLWSDPQPAKGRGPSKRGVGLAFGPDVTKRFLDANGLGALS